LNEKLAHKKQKFGGKNERSNFEVYGKKSERQRQKEKKSQQAPKAMQHLKFEEAPKVAAKPKGTHIKFDDNENTME
jgi:hypothetical protein